MNFSLTFNSVLTLGPRCKLASLIIDKIVKKSLESYKIERKGFVILGVDFRAFFILSSFSFDANNCFSKSAW
jgi:hypothetical protein